MIYEIYSVYDEKYCYMILEYRTKRWLGYYIHGSDHSIALNSLIHHRLNWRL